jgi:hypothetical protein
VDSAIFKTKFCECANSPSRFGPRHQLHRGTTRGSGRSAPLLACLVTAVLRGSRPTTAELDEGENVFVSHASRRHVLATLSRSHYDVARFSPQAWMTPRIDPSLPRANSIGV